MYEWAANEIFDLTTYDGELDELFVKKIIETSKAIIDRKTSEYIEQSENNYIVYILACQIFNKNNWIDWGTSIRGSWFDEHGYLASNPKPIIDTNLKDYGVDEIPFTIENFKLLIDFISKEGVSHE